MLHRLGYRAAITWLLDNDDTEFLDEPAGVPSVAAYLVADIFGKDITDVLLALRKARDARRKVCKSCGRAMEPAQ